MSRVNRIIVVASLSFFPAVLSAQTCMGGASFADHLAQVGGDASFGTGARSASGGLGIGSRYGPFAAIGFGAAHDDDLHDNARIFTATAGIAAPIPPRPKTQICPFFAALTLNGVELQTGESLSSQAFGLGASVGTVLSAVPELEVVPFASAALVTQIVTVHHPFPGPTTAETNHHYGMSLGVGLVFAKVITIRPSTTFTLGQGRTTRSYGLHFTLSFGAVGHRAPAIEREGSLAIVWLNERAGVYYCQGSRWYGATAYGTFVTEREALATGALPENGRRC